MPTPSWINLTHYRTGEVVTVVKDKIVGLCEVKATGPEWDGSYTEVVTVGRYSFHVKESIETIKERILEA